MESAKSIFHDCKLLVYIWTEAVAIAVYLTNQSSTRANNGQIPETKYSSKITNISNLQIFGCITYVHVPKEQCQKLDSKTQMCLFLGYDNETKAYKLHDNLRRKVMLY